MKKALILIIACVCLLQINGLCQKTQVGLTAGVTSSNMMGSLGGGDTHYKSRWGFSMGMYLNAPIGKSNFAFMPTLQYIQKGDFTTKTANLKEGFALRYAEMILDVVHYTKSKKLF